MTKSWYPEELPIYDIHQTYLDNLNNGPFFQAPIPKRPATSQSIPFLGHLLNSPIGIPAGPLLGSKWIALAAKLGYDLLVYKTIRSEMHPSHGLPNMIYVEPIDRHTARTLEEGPNRLEEVTVTNSFGMPSRSPEFLIADIDAANRCLGPGQLLIVSVVGTPHRGESFLHNFVQTALFAKEAGAKVIEVNYSCPNVDKHEGSLYMSPDTVREYTRAIVDAIHPIPLVLKIGELPSVHLMQQILHSAARSGASAICGLNSVSMRVIDATGAPALGPARAQSGVCGAAIRSRALHFVRHAARIISKDKLDLTLMGCGGIMAPEHFDEFLQAGANIAMTATGMLWDPLLALRYHEKYQA